MQITPRSRAAWRRWLAKHHASRDEVWLVFYKRHTGKPTVTYAAAVEEAICFGWIDGVRRSVDASRYMHRFSPRRPDSRWSATNRRRAGQLAAAGLMTPAGRAAIAAAKRNGTWDAPRPAVDVTMPPALAEALERDPTAARFFDSLTPKQRQQFLGWINLAKRAETRERRIAETLVLLARGEKLGMR